MKNSERKRKNGFSLVELVVVVSVLAVLSAIAIPSFICFPKRARATAALRNLRQIKTECALKEAEAKPEIFTLSSLDGYTIQTNGPNSCSGSNGLIKVVPQDLETYPVFNLSTSNGEISYTYRGVSSSNLKECLDLICSNGIYQSKKVGIDEFRDKFNAAITDGLTLEEGFYRRGDSIYAIVIGDTWEKAQENARKLGGNLATINDEEENNWLKSQLFGDGKASNKLTDKLALPGEDLRGSSIWLGHTSHRNSSQYESITGEKNLYSNWAPGEKNDGIGKGEKYTIMTLFDNYNRDPGQMMTVSNRQYNTEELVERGGAHIFYGLAEIKTNEIMEVDDDIE